MGTTHLNSLMMEETEAHKKELKPKSSQIKFLHPSVLSFVSTCKGENLPSRASPTQPHQESTTEISPGFSA